MHVVIAFAAPMSDAGADARRALRLPNLAAWLSGARPGELAAGDEWSFSTPHERALAQAFGWSGDDGRLPWAAWQAAADGIEVGTRPWALLTPAHWRLGTEQISLMDPAELRLDADESRAWFDLVGPLFTSEGFELRWGAPLRWYASHPSLAGWSTASPDRVIGRNVDHWLAGAREARLARRLQNEVQMLLHEHPLNAAREARGLPALNSIWISGCGVHQPARGQALLEDRLRAPALAENWDAWSAAWQRIDADWPTRGATSLTLCGERAWRRFEPRAQGLLARLTAPLRRVDVAALREAL